VVEDQIQVRALFGKDTDLNLHPGVAKYLETSPGMLWIGIVRADDHALDAGCDDRLCARWRASVCATRFKRYVQRGVGLGFPAEGAQGHDLGVRLTRLGVEPLGNDLAVLDNQRADHRIGMRRAPTAPR
jgi:hypothetical protein